MAGIRYEGRNPDGDNSLVTRQWSDQNAAALAVTTTYVNGEISRVVNTANLKTTTYVDTQDALLAKLATVQSADAAYLESTARNTTVASLNASGMLTSSQVPTTLVTERSIQTVAASGASFSGTYTCTTSTVRERLLATVTIADPGFPWVALPFGSVTGQAGNTPALHPWSGNSTCGQLTVCPPEGSGDTIYGLGACTDSSTAEAYPILPYAGSNATPVNRPAINGALTLNLYGCCFQGSGYIFSATGLSFYVIVIPAM